MFRVLIADDEERIRRLVSDFLKKDGYEVLQASDGKEAVDVLEENPGGIDLVILDVMMPGLDGWSVLRHIRKSWPDLPVVMLTARTEDIDEVFGFDLGADDYVGKPFSPMVLAARIKTIIKRRYEMTDGGIETFGDLVINEKSRVVSVKNERIALTPKEYDLLIYMKDNCSIAISRENILNAVWGFDYFGDFRTVDTHIKKLRAKLKSCEGVIQTVRGYGYRFEVEQ